MIQLAELFTEEMSSQLTTDGLKETTKITQTENRLKQEETSRNPMLQS